MTIRAWLHTFTSVRNQLVYYDILSNNDTDMVEPDSMPGNVSFIAGFAQSNVCNPCSVILCIMLMHTHRLATPVRIHWELFAKAPGKTTTANLVTSCMQRAAQLCKTVMDGK